MRRWGGAAASAVCAAALVAGCSSAGGERLAAGSPSSRPAAAAPTRTAATRPAAPKAPALPEGYDASRNARADVAAAFRQAAADGRPVLIDFGADWCPDCRVLGTLFRDPSVRPLTAGYHVVQVDVGQFDHNLDVARSYGIDLRSSGIPALAVYGPDRRLRVASNGGEFADARGMTAAQVGTFLKRWSHG